MDDWLKLREEMDPDQVLVSDYGRGILETPVKSEQTLMSCTVSNDIELNVTEKQRTKANL